MTDQVHQLARAHAEAAALAHHRVERRGRRGLFLQQPQRLAVVRPGDAVDDKPRRRPAQHRHLAPGLRGLEDRPRDLRRGGRAADHLDQRQHVAGLKKCMPTTRSGRARRPAIAVTDSDEVFVAMIVSGPSCDSICPQHRDLDLEVLDDDLDHQADVVKLGFGVDRPQPREDRVALGGAETATFDPLVEAARGSASCRDRAQLGWCRAGRRSGLRRRRLRRCRCPSFRRR